MTDISILCTACRNLSEVPRQFISVEVQCPFCSEIFQAFPNVAMSKDQSRLKNSPAPTVYPAKKTTKPEEKFDSGHGATDLGKAAIIGLALIPLMMPLIWIGAIVLLGRDPLFTPMVPLSIGLGATAIGIGAVLTEIWKTRTKLWTVLSIVFFTYLVGLTLFYMKKEWVEAVRNKLGADEFDWSTYEPGPFRVKLPGKKKQDDNPTVPEWKLYSVIHTNEKATGYNFRVSHGSEPEEYSKLDDKTWLEKAGETLANEERGKPVKATDIKVQGYSGREWVFSKAENASNLTIRLVRVKSAMIMLSVDGPFLTNEAKEVQIFFKSLYIHKIE
jgi:hypothetical protein